MSMRTVLGSVLIVFASLYASGCGCSETDIGGDTATDSDAPFGDPSFDPPIGDPSFDPPIENLGDPGWRDSEEPYSRCSGWVLESWDVWSDSRGVFALVLEHNPGPGHWPTDDPTESPEQHYIAFNDGTGWRLLFDHYGDFYGCEHRMTGLPGGNLVVYSRDSYMCEWEAGTEAGVTVDNFEAQRIHVVDETLAYALRVSGLIAFYDGEGWGPYPSDPIPYEVYCLWADHTSLFVAGPEGLIMSDEEEGWRVHDTGTLDYITAIWGFAGDDVWAGTMEGGLMHWDGDTWEDVEWPDLSDPAEYCSTNEIQGFWGKDGILFFYTGNEIVRWDGVEFTVLGYWPRHRDPAGTGCVGGLGILDIWGNDVDEVFLSVGTSEERLLAGCEYEFLLWWDGAEFHWF